MVQGIWRELGPLIVLAHLLELLGLLAAVAALAVSVWWGLRRKRWMRWKP